MTCVTESDFEITQVLDEWSDGRPEALEELMELVQGELRELARFHFRGERQGHTLQPTALINEVYLRLIQQRRTAWRSRHHFFAFASELMRRVLVDHIRRKLRDRRGAGATVVEFQDGSDSPQMEDRQVLRLHDALNELESIDPRKSRVVVLRYFGGLTLRETADALGISPATVKREWTLARSWLYRELDETGE